MYWRAKRRRSSQLIEAAEEGDFVIVKDLLSKGADVNAKDKVGATALMGAAVRGHIKIVEILLAKGADVNAKRRDGWTAKQIALMRGYKSLADYIQHCIDSRATQEHPPTMSNQDGR